MSTTPSSATQQLLRQELHRRWLAGEQEALRAIIDALPPEQRGPALHLLLPDELGLRQRTGEKLDKATLSAKYPEAKEWLEDLLEDALTVHLSPSGESISFPASWSSTDSAMRPSVAEPTLGTERMGEFHFVGRSPEPPRQIDHYEILEEIGRGGMGVVYKARDRKLKRVVALKMMLSGAFADAASRTRFRREAEALAQVQHPHLVQVYDVGEEHGHPYVVLEFIDGITLAAFARRRPIDPRLAATWLEKIARAVQAAHDRGIVHRDLKPGNVLLGMPADSGIQPEGYGSGRGLNPFTLVPKLTDFGLAKRLDAHTAATTAGQVLGTAQYMAPEQTTGDSSQVGPAADVYGLGAVLYEMLTGLPPVSGENLIEMMLQVQGRDPAAPSQFLPSLPRDLETICLKCLEKEPSRRYPSAADLADELARFLRREPIAARPVSGLEKAWRWCRRNPMVAGLTAALVSSLALLALVFGWQWRQAQAANRELAERNTQLAAARDEAQRARQSALAQRDDLRRQNATATFLRGVETAEAGDATLGLFLMARSLELSTPEMTDFHRVVRVNLAEWSRYVPQVLGPLAGAPARLCGIASDRAHAWVWPEDREELWLVHLDTGQTIGQPLVVPPPPHNWRRGRRLSGRWLSLPFHSPARVEVWDLERRLRHAIVEHVAPVWGSSVRADGCRLATLDEDGRVRIWELPSGRLLAGPTPTITRMNREFITLEHGCSGDLLIKGEGLGLVLAGDTAQPRLPEPGGVALTFHPQPQRMLVERRGADTELVGRLGIVNSASGQLVSEFNLPHGLILHTASFSGAGDVLAIAAHDRQVNFWDRGEGRPVWAPLRGQEARTAVFDRDFKFGVTRHQRFLLPRPVSSLGSPPNLAAVPARRRLTYQRQAVQLGPAARWAATVQRAATEQPLAVRFLDLATGMPYGQPIPVAGDTVRAMAASPDGNFLALASFSLGVYAGWVNVCDARTGRPLLPPLEHTNYTSALAFAPDGQRLAVSDYNRQILIWNLASGRLDRAPLLETEIVTALAWSPDGRTLAVGTSLDFSRRPHVRLWDVDRGQPRHEPLSLRSELEALEFTPDSQAILATSHDSAVVIDVNSGKARHPELLVPTLNVSAVSAVGDWFALGDGEGSVYLHRLSTGAPVGKLACRQAIFSLAFSPDGTTLAVGSQNGATRIWDLATRLPVGAPRVQSASIVALAYRSEASTLVTASSDGRVREWPLPPPLENTEHLRPRLEVSTGLRFDGTDLSVMSPEDWNAQRAALARLTALQPFAPRLSDVIWHDQRARDADADNDAWAALWHLDRLLAAQPEAPGLLLRRAQAYLSRGEQDAARADCQRAERLLADRGSASSLNLPSWHFDRLLVLWAQGETRQALWHAQQLADRWPSGQASWWRAELHRALGMAAAAADDEQRALELGLPSHQVYELIVRRAEAGDWQRASELYDAARKHALPPLLVRGKLAVVLAKAGRANEAAPFWEDLVVAMETRATGAWVRQQVWTMVAFDCPHPLLERMLARVEALKPPATDPLRGAYEATAGALQIRLGQRSEGAARLLAALPEGDEQMRASWLAMLAIAAVGEGNVAGARHLLGQARASVSDQSSIWLQACTGLLLDEVEKLVPKQ